MTLHITLGELIQLRQHYLESSHYAENLAADLRTREESRKRFAEITHKYAARIDHVSDLIDSAVGYVEPENIEPLQAEEEATHAD